MRWPIALTKITSSPDGFEESLPHPLVRVDGNIAMVCGVYTAVRNGQPDHCGASIFTLVKEVGRWLIASITDNSRPCQAGSGQTTTPA